MAHSWAGMRHCATARRWLSSRRCRGADVARFALSAAPFDIAPLRARLLDDRAGGYASFEGWVRNVNEGRAVDALTYEAYAALAETEGEKVLAEAVERFAILDAACVHRVGRLELGEMAVWVGVAAGHRDGAFAACRWIIDEVKARVPIWKQEHYVDGDAGWLHPPAGEPTVGGA
jgi:molybdopterin synthase catalytic subunit